MRLYMFHRSGLDQEELRNSNGVGGVLVLAENADEAEARLKAQDAATSGETTIYADWQATLLADTGVLPGGRECLFIGEVFCDKRRPV